MLQRAENHGSVADAHCTHAVAEVLQGVPGFETINTTWFPNKLSDEFAKIPGASFRRITDDDADQGQDHQ